jgi:hypothetical protein
MILFGIVFVVWMGLIFVIVAFVVPSGRLYQGKVEDESGNKQVRGDSRRQNW